MRKPSQLIPENTMAGNALTIVVAIMCFLACLTLGSVTLVRDASREWQGDILREVTIQVRPSDGRDSAADAAKAASIARLFPGVASAEVLSDQESNALLEPWLGTGLDLSDLPVPRLIVVRVSDPDRVDLAELGLKIKAEVPTATLDDHRAWTSRIQTMASATVLVGLSILALVFVATILSVVFATRGAMAGNKDVVSVLHFVGAEDGYIAREFQRHFLMLGLRGGLFGFLKKKPKPMAPDAEAVAAGAGTGAIEQTTLDPVAATASAALDRVEAQTAPQAVAAAPAAIKRGYIQIGIFSTEANANRASEQMKGAGMTATVRTDQSAGKTYWRVIVGPAATVAERDALVARVKGIGYPDAYPVSN